jgi:hypothetical protein
MTLTGAAIRCDADKWAAYCRTGNRLAAMAAGRELGLGDGRWSADPLSDLDRRRG